MVVDLDGKIRSSLKTHAAPRSTRYRIEADARKEAREKEMKYISITSFIQSKEIVNSRIDGSKSSKCEARHN